jgi:hypothetical protein
MCRSFALTFLGKQRKTVHRQSEGIAAEPFRSPGPPRRGGGPGARRMISNIMLQQKD